MSIQREKVLTLIKQHISEVDPFAEVILYGSRARGDERPFSDWDILILVNSEADIEAEKLFRHKLFDLELEIGEAFSTFVYNKQEWESKHWMTPLYKNIAVEGITI